MTILRSGALVLGCAASLFIADSAVAQTVTVGDTRYPCPVGPPVETEPCRLYRVGHQRTVDGNLSEFAMGQLFQTPDNTSTTLTSWSLWATDWYRAFDPFEYQTAPFQLSIIEWDGSAPAGAALYTSDAVTPTSPDSTGDRFTFAIGEELDPTKMYIALVSMAQGAPVPSSVAGHWAAAAIQYSCVSTCGYTDVYPGGSFVTFNPSTGESAVFPQYDMRFEATFDGPVTATPEPASLALMATGLGSVAGWMRRRRRNHAAGLTA